MQTNELLTVQQFADAAGITKQAVYKALNNKLKPYIQLVDGKKMLQNRALREVYGVEVDQRESQPLNNQSQPLEAVIAMLQRELEIKNGQIEALQRQNEQLTSALENTTSSLQAAQALHAGTMQQQLSAPEEQVEEEISFTEQKKMKKRNLWERIFNKE